MQIKIKTIKKILGRTCLVIAGMCIFYLILLCFPQPFFSWSVSANNLTLYSDQPFSSEAGKKVLELTQAKLAASELFLSQQHHTIFICNARWRQRLFFNYNYGVGGVNYYPITSNVFLRDAIIEENRLISPSGNLVPANRSLDYFVAHEITHTLTGQAIGGFRFYQLSEWVREGYADYIGKGNTFNYQEACQAFLAEDPEMDKQKSGLYLRYNLLVTYLLEKKHLGVQKLLQDSTEQSAVESMLRKEISPK